MLSAKDFLLLALALGWLLFVVFLGYVLIRLGSVLKSTEALVNGVTERTVPLLGEVTTSVVQVNGQLEKVDTITTNAATVSSNVAALVSLFGATLGGPLIKVAAFSYGVRRAAARKSKSDIEREVKSAIKADRKSARAAKRGL
ncbi:MAG TPA: DUF948 domain-containing protein [Mycobacteriales bacterium]|nr:DUF948 domain-containing protein [Mycobacteriales bacterium]